MALLFSDSGGDHYATAEITEKITQIVTTGAGEGAGVGSVTIQAVGRNSTNGYRFRSGSSGQSAAFASITLSASGDTFVAQVGFRCVPAFSGLAVGTDGSGAGGTTNVLFNVRNAGAFQFWAQVNQNGTITLYRGTTALLTTTVAMQQNVYHYLKVKVVIHDSAGTAEIVIDGVSKSDTGLNTQGAGAATWDEFRWGSITGPGVGDWHFDDLILMDGSGSAYNDLIGEQRVLCCFVNAEGAHTDGTPSAGADRSLMVDETSANGDTDYNTKDTSTQRDSFAIAGWPSTGVIGAIQLVGQARKEDEGAANIALGVRIDGTDYDGDSQGLSTDYAMKRQIFELNPGTSADWQPGAPPELVDLKSA